MRKIIKSAHGHTHMHMHEDGIMHAHTHTHDTADFDHFHDHLGEAHAVEHDGRDPAEQQLINDPAATEPTDLSAPMRKNSER